MSIANDRRSFTLIFDQFVASAGPGVPAEEQNKNCAITVHMHLAPGWQTWLQTATRRGYVQLGEAVQGSSKARYVVKSPSSSDQSRGQSGVNQNSQVDFAGPVAKDYLGGDAFSITAQAPNTCNEVPGRRQDLTILVESSLTGDAPSQLTVDSVDGALSVTSVEKSKSCR